MIHFNIILPSTPGSPKCRVSFRFPGQYFVRICHLLGTVCGPPILSLLSYSPFYFSAKSTNFEAADYTFFQLLVIFSPLEPNILLCILFSSRFNQCSFFRIRDKVSYPYKATGIAYVSYLRQPVVENFGKI
jgi:hypothetical protein